MTNNLEERLREASCLEDVDTVNTLLGQNVDVNAQNPVNGWTALHWAYKRGNESVARLLIEHGADDTVKNFKGETPVDLCINPTTLEHTTQEEVKFTPNYLRNPPLNGQVELGNRLRGKHTDFAKMPTTVLPSSMSDDLVLKVRIHGSSDPDYIEVEIPRWKLTYSSLLKICCEELNVCDSQVDRIRKLPDTRLRNDNDVKRLKDLQSLEVVLKSPISSEKNCYQSISTCKNQTILY